LTVDRDGLLPLGGYRNRPLFGVVWCRCWNAFSYTCSHLRTRCRGWLPHWTSGVSEASDETAPCTSRTL